MFYVVTLSLRTVSAVHVSLYSHCSKPVADVAATITHNEHSPMKHKVNDELIYCLLLGLSQPMPDHITFPIRPNVLPARILLFYFDEVQGRAFTKSKAIKDTFCVNGQYRHIIADVERTTETELRSFVQAGGIIKNVVKLRRDALATMLILGDYRKAASERTRIQALHTRLEERAERLQEEAKELKFIELKLVDANAKVKKLVAKVKDLRRDSLGQKVADEPKHRYPTRYSLTSSVVEREEDS